MQISDHRYLEKVFTNLQKKLNLAEDAPVMCRQQWKPPFTWDKITLRIWKFSRLRTSRNFLISSESLRSWYWIKRRLFHGRDLHFLTIKWSRGRKQKYASTQIPSYAWENVRPFRSESKIGKSRKKNLNSSILADNYKDFENFEDRIIVMSMLNDIKWTKEILKIVFHIPKMSRNTRRDPREDTGHSSALEMKEMIWNSRLYTWRKVRFYRHTVGGRFKKRPPIIQYSRASVLWVVRFWKQKNHIGTIHFNADASNSNLVSNDSLSKSAQFSAEQSQAGVKSSVWSRMREMTSERFATIESMQIMKELKPQEVNSLVQTPRSDDTVSGNRLRGCLQNFGTFEKEIQFTKICEDASFWMKKFLSECVTRPLQT